MERVPIIRSFEQRCSCGTSVHFKAPLTEIDNFTEYKCPRCGNLLGEGLTKLATAVNEYNESAAYVDNILSLGFSGIDAE